MLKTIATNLRFPFKSYAFQDHPYRIDDLQEDYLYHAGGGTNEIKMLELIESEARPTTKDRLLFFVTDGYCNGNTQPYLAQLETLNFLTIGISVGVTDSGANNQLRKLFPNNLIVTKPEDLPSALLSKLKGLIKR